MINHRFSRHVFHCFPPHGLQRRTAFWTHLVHHRFVSRWRPPIAVFDQPWNNAVAIINFSRQNSRCAPAGGWKHEQHPVTSPGSRKGWFEINRYHKNRPFIFDVWRLKTASERKRLRNRAAKSVKLWNFEQQFGKLELLLIATILNLNPGLWNPKNVSWKS